MPRPQHLFLSTLFLLFASHSLQAQPDVGDFGFGIILGEPTGLTAKGSLGGENAWDLAIGAGGFRGLRIHADYLWNIDAFGSSETGLYIGLGGVIGFGKGNKILFDGKHGDNDDVAIGVRGVFGLNSMPFKAPLELFVEVAPVLSLIPSTGVGTDLAVGIRYYP